MGDKLLKYYEFVKEKARLEGAMRLAMKTKIPSTRAQSEPDSPENLRQFREAVKEITGQEVDF